MDAVDQAIIETIERVTHPATGAFERVYPHQVAVYLPVRMGARAVRYRMVRLAESGAIWRRPGYYTGYVSVTRAECEARAALARALAQVEAIFDRYGSVLDRQDVMRMVEIA